MSTLNAAPVATAVREITFSQAIREALAEEMRRDPTVFIIGEDVAEAGTPFKVMLGLVDEFGPNRIIDAPISEPGFCGMGVGAAMTGMRPVVDIMFGDFLGLAMDQIANQAAKIHYMSGGKLSVPIVFRTSLGATRRAAAQHSQSLQAWPSHIPGLKVALPATPYDAKGLLKTAIRDNNPVVFIEDKMLHQTKGPVPEGEYTLPFGVADIKRSGEDISLVATSSMVQVALAAAEQLAKLGISAEVVDPRTSVPLDVDTILESVAKTHRLLIVDEDFSPCGAGAEIAAQVMERGFYELDAPVRRLNGPFAPAPYSPPLEAAAVPHAQAIFRAAQALLVE
ncbi:MAG TPA: alpha-ketoacid dehydrogenase subunit beta [Anaerolineales bacterium]